MDGECTVRDDSNRLGDDIKAQCSGNFLDSMRLNLVRPSGMGRYGA